MKETIEELWDEYGVCFAVVDRCDDTDGCQMCVEDKESMQEIIQEITTKIEENVLREVMGEVRAYKNYYNPIGDEVNQERHRTMRTADTGREITHCFASVASDTIIDVVNPDTGRTGIYSKDLDECRKEYPDAQLMTIQDWCEQKAKRQDTPIIWTETTAGGVSDARVVMLAKGGRGSLAKH